MSAIREDRAGSVWIGTVGFRAGGLARIENNLLRYLNPKEGGYVGKGVLSLAEDRNGNVWIGSVEGLHRWGGSGFETHQLPGGQRRVGPMVSAGGDGIIFAGPGGGLKWVTADGVQDYSPGKFGTEISARVLLSDRDGSLWIGTNGQGIIHLHHGSVDQFTRAEGLSGDTVFSLFEDREGNIWVGTERGFDRFRDLPVRKLSKRDGLSEDSVDSVFASKSGGVWIGTGGGLNKIDGERVEAISGGAAPPSDVIVSIFEDDAGQLWVDTPRGLFFRRDGKFQPFDLPQLRKIRAMSAAVEDHDGTLWIADSANGLISVQANKVREILPWSTFSNQRASSLAANPERGGGIVLGFAEGGIAYYREGYPLRWYTKTDGLGSGAVRDLHFDRQGTLWIATQSGLSRLRNGHAATLSMANGLACEQIHAVIEDEDGAMWLNTPCGLQSISQKDLTAWAENRDIKIRAQLYSPSDGMDSRASVTGFRGAARSTDGRLWFPVFDGVAVVDPKSLHRNPLPPPVAIVAIRVDDHEHEPKASLRVGPITKDLRIDYTALSLVDPERVRFRYKLEGYDEGWRDATDKRQAVYPALSPQSYRFRVTAANNDGVWSEAGTYIDFAVNPTLSQTTWFRGLSVIAVVATLWSAHLFRLRLRERQLNVLFEERLRERTRLGRELHDTLLQTLPAFALQLGGMAKTVQQQPQTVEQKLNTLRRDVERTAHDVREAVWDLRSLGSEQGEFPEAARRAAEDIVRGTAITLSMEVFGEPHQLDQQTQGQLQRLVEEALRNAVRHASPTEISLTFRYTDNGHISISITDNGCGFDLETASARSGHWGLVTMGERARKIGADLKIASEPNRGTRVDINMRTVGL